MGANGSKPLTWVIDDTADELGDGGGICIDEGAPKNRRDLDDLVDPGSLMALRFIDDVGDGCVPTTRAWRDGISARSDGGHTGTLLWTKC